MVGARVKRCALAAKCVIIKAWEMGNHSVPNNAHAAGARNENGNAFSPNPRVEIDFWCVGLSDELMMKRQKHKFECSLNHDFFLSSVMIQI
jgi:hypothetical protein